MTFKKIRKALHYAKNLAKSDLMHAFPGSFRLLEIQPSSCNIMITNRCNLRCGMCRQWKERAADELTGPEWQKIMDDLWVQGFRNIHFTGGEPLLRLDIAELIEYASRKGFAVGMTTNGMLLTQEKLDAIIDAGLAAVTISVDAIGPEYDRIRGVEGAFIRAEEAIRLVSEKKRRGKIYAYVNFTLMNDTIESFEKVKSFLGEVELPVHICLLDKNSAIFDVEENRSAKWFSSKEDLDKLERFADRLECELISNGRSIILNYPGIQYIKDYFRDPRQETIPCVNSQDRIFVGPDGTLFGGCLCKGEFGNLTKLSFAELRRSDGYAAAKRDMFYKKCAGCSCGYLFNIQHSMRSMAYDLLRRVGDRIGVRHGTK